MFEGLGPHDPGRLCLGQLDHDHKPLTQTAHRSADDKVDIEHPACFFRADLSIMQGEDASLRDDEKASQLGKPGDHVIRKSVGDPPANP